MKIAYFDCFSGAGGDMINAALIDAGAPADALRERLNGLGLSGYRLSIDKVKKQGFAATRFNVELDPAAAHPHRHLKHILKILDDGNLPDSTRRKATAIFTRLAEAEAAVHNSTIDKVHFHEVGAVDAVLDIVGAVTALELLGIEQVFCSPVVTGSGTVRCDHGLMPVPPPAVARMLEGVSIVPTTEQGELLTPTAAAILTTLATGFGPAPAMTIRSIGYGAGTRDTVGLPNVLRVIVGETAEGGGDVDWVTMLETNLDDATPEVVGHCLERLMAAGALDAYVVPINMKKWRCGVVLTVLCAEPHAETMERIIFAETPTFGIRRRRSERVRLARRHETVDTPFGPIRIKVGRRGETTTASPEFDDCRAAAVQRGVPLREVMTAAEVAWAKRSTHPAP